MTDRPRRSSIDPVTREAAAWFARLRADDVSEQDRARFEGWLGADPKHREAYAGFERFWSTTGSYAGHPKVAEAVHDAAALAPAVASGPAAAAPPARAATPRRRQGRRRTFAMAASVALAVLITGVIAAWPSTNQAYETDVGEQRSIALADGSRLTLNTDTRVRVSYTDRRRAVKLERGQAYFRVAKDASRPFDVETRKGIVRAIGTAFDIYETGKEVVVTVVEGTVLVTDPADRDSTLPAAMTESAGGKRKILRANERLALASVEQIALVEVQPAPVEASVAWLNGKLIFDNEPLDKAVGEINRYSDKHILLGDERLKSLHMSGVFRVGEPGDFVASVSNYFGLRVESDADGNYVLHARR